LAHVLLNHVAEKLSYINVIHLALLLPMALLWAFIPSNGIAVITDWFIHQVIDLTLELPYSRDIEHEADLVGLQLAARACVDVREAPAFWGRMAIRSLEAESEEDVQPPEILSTHPAHEKRAERLVELLPAAIELRKQCGCSNVVFDYKDALRRAMQYGPIPRQV
jgi:predicted Zn-dependent protease